MKYNRRQFIIGILIFAIIYIISLFFALNNKENQNLILCIVMFSLIIFCLIADGIERKIKGYNAKKDINFPFFLIISFLTYSFTACVLVTIDSLYLKFNGIETTATIYNVDRKIEYKTEYDDDGDSYEVEEEKCDLYIEYFVDGKRYDSKLNLSTCMKKEGDKVKIYYSKDDPSIYDNDSSYFSILGAGLTLLALVICLYKSIKELFGKNK